MASTVAWLGQDFNVCEYHGDWNAVPGLYIFAGVDSTAGVWRPLYVGAILRNASSRSRKVGGGPATGGYPRSCSGGTAGDEAAISGARVDPSIPASSKRPASVKLIAISPINYGGRADS